MAIMLGIALWPAFILVQHIYRWGADLLNLMHLLCVAISCGIGYFIFGITLLVLIVIVKWVTFSRSPEGTYHMLSPKLANWVMINGMMMMAWFFFLQFTRTTRINTMFYRLLGMKVGRDVIIDTVHVYDVDLIEMGDRAVIGGDAVIMAHVLEGDSVYYKRTRIGRGAIIGYGTIVLAGAEIGDGAIVGAGSLVLKDTVLPPRTVWGGIPVRKIKDLDSENR